MKFVTSYRILELEEPFAIRVWNEVTRYICVAACFLLLVSMITQCSLRLDLRSSRCNDPFRRVASNSSKMKSRRDANANLLQERTEWPNDKDQRVGGDIGRRGNRGDGEENTLRTRW